MERECKSADDTDAEQLAIVDYASTQQKGARLLRQKCIDWLWNACGRNASVE